MNGIPSISHAFKLPAPDASWIAQASGRPATPADIDRAVREIAAGGGPVRLAQPILPRELSPRLEFVDAVRSVLLDRIRAAAKGRVQDLGQQARNALGMMFGGKDAMGPMIRARNQADALHRDLDRALPGMAGPWGQDGIRAEADALIRTYAAELNVVVR